MRALAEQLRAAGVPCFPCWVRHNPAKGKYDKGPRVPGGEAWQLSALRPVEDPQLDWDSGVIGIPIPAGVLALDLDSYKGATREAVDEALGCALPWDQALAQTTISGGQHFLFRCPWDARQGDDLLGVKGFDTRAAGRGFICSGQGYSPVQHGGVLALGDLSLLPEMPEEARGALERKQAAPTPLPTGADIDSSKIRDALEHIDPGCSRERWRNVGYSLKAAFVDDDYAGMQLFDEWSSGVFWPTGCPHNYVASGKGSTEDQWPTFKAEGGINPATLYYYAIEEGWRPPADFAVNVSGAFAPVDVFADLVETIRTDGADIKRTQDIVDAIRAAGCSALQTALLAAELKTELTGAGLKDKAVASHIDGLLEARPIDHAPRGMYGKNDADNAVLFLERFHPGAHLCRCDGLFYTFTGRVWESFTADTLRHEITIDMAAQRQQDSRIAACYRMVSNMCDVKDGQLGECPDNLIVFNNGVLNTDTWELTPHTPELFTTNLLPYDWVSSGACPGWLAFLDDVFTGDRERVALLQEWLGYIMTRGYAHQKIMFMLGGPRSGKGTIGRVISHLVGAENFCGGSLSSLASDSYIDGISEKPVVFIGDAEKKVAPQRTSQVIERLKTISGNDEISWHRMYHGGLSRALPTRFTIAANSVPQLFDDSGALASRLLLLTFDKSYLGAEDLTLGDRLLAEVEGIAAWAMAGLVRLRQCGRFTEPEASREEAALIAEAYSPVLRFIEECCEVVPGGEVTSRDLYDTYRAWAVGEGEEPMRPKSLTSSIRDAHRGRRVTYGTHRFADGERGRGFKGIRLRGEAVARTAQGAFQPKVVS